MDIKRRLGESQWLSHDRIKEIQQEKLTRFLFDIYESNQFYRHIFENFDIEPVDFKNADVLSKIPLLDKKVIREHSKDFLSDNSNNAKFLSTSGSSGQPLKFAVGNERVSHDVAAKWRATNWWGVELGEKEAVIWGSNIELSGQGLVKNIRDLLFRTKLFPAQKLDKAGIASLFNGLQQYQPSMMYGYPSILTLIAEHAKTHQLVFKPGALKVIFCTAEKLYEHQRAIIEEVFQAPVANGYGSRDAGFIAHECPFGNLHISEEDIIVEVLDDHGQPCSDGMIGNLVVTNLTTRDFPMLRYQTGDLAATKSGKCQCGRNLKMLAEVVGRSNDVLTASNGASVHGAYIGNIIREDEAICHFQLIQEQPLAFTLNIVCYPNTTILEPVLIDKLTTVLGQDISIHIEVMSEIPSEQTGKYKYIINKCQ
ncbi:phenylacetate--CoA ligase family protein [Candidatus Colwellia aromaticivorans]|uniref:phenylacetate--CoA ligase family protein n=1 Tax=Candidatus Colwellia aromaticivorans TaxID=2267621 RepID=UPI001444479E|nr:AMP-binding protein [Candidatus Colwellia aromaticivorans]